MAEREQNNSVRREMLAAIREHLAASAPFDAVYEEHQARHEGATQTGGQAVIANEAAVSLAERFRQSLEAVAGHCLIVRDEVEAAEAVQRIIGQMKAERVAVSNSPLVRKVLERVQADASLIENAAAADLFDCDVGITGAQWAVAETGTLVLESEQERHRLSSLVPPVHVAMIEAGRLRETLGEVLQSLGAKGRDGLSRTVTFITGPSRTSDIELNLAIGVHGPGELYVIILEGA